MLTLQRDPLLAPGIHPLVYPSRSGGLEPQIRAAPLRAVSEAESPTAEEAGQRPLEVGGTLRGARWTATLFGLGAPAPSNLASSYAWQGTALFM
jgi:hypothetical protein